MKTIKDYGSCLCQKVKVNANTLKPHVGACHCSMCRKWGGAPLMSLQGGSDVEFKGQEHIQVYDSSVWAERGFCKHCGTHLFYRIKESSEYYLPAGLFDDNTAFEFKQQIYIDKKPAYYSFTEKTNNFTEAELCALISSQK